MISFESIKNFSDISYIGEVIIDKQKMRSGAIFRSEEISALSPADWDKVKRLGIKCIIDLRTPNEKTVKPYQVNNKNINMIHVPILSEDKDLNRWQFFLFLVHRGPTIDFGQYMLDFYHRLAFERKGEIKQVISILSVEENVPVLIHCTGGKDRTGFIVALLQLIVGISKENVLESYLDINRMIAPKMQKIQSYIRWMSLGRVSPERFKPMMEVRKEYLEHALQEIDRQYHSLDQYLIEGCGVDQHCLEKVRYLLRGNSDKN